MNSIPSSDPAGSPFANITPTLREHMAAARRLARTHCGRVLTVYLPGMFRVQQRTGRYPAVSITGSACELQCDHCRGGILQTMRPAVSPRALIALGRRLRSEGRHGLLISGGSDVRGRLPWEDFCDAIATVKAETGLYVSVHCGLVDAAQARALKQAGVDQALIDVVGDDATFRRVLHLDGGVARLRLALEALHAADLAVIPHIVCGLDYGRITGEKAAVALLRDYRPAQIVIVVLMRVKGAPTNQAAPPPAEAVAEIIAAARLAHPAIPVSLGCARPRGQVQLELLALEAGVSRMALPSPEALFYAKNMGLTIDYQDTCCSVSAAVRSTPWEA